MNKIPTAKEFLEYRTPRGITNDYPDYWDAMIEFTKLHVNAALESASKKATTKDMVNSAMDVYQVVDEQSILNSYPINNIK